MTIRDFLDYEIRSSWWASFIWWNWGRNLAGMWFAWKTKRKYSRYIDSRLDKAMAELMRQCKDETPNAKSQATDAALSRQVACTDGLATGGKNETT